MKGFLNRVKTLLRPVAVLVRGMVTARRRAQRQKVAVRWFSEEWAEDDCFLDALDALRSRDYHRAVELSSGTVGANHIKPWVRYVAGEVDSFVTSALRAEPVGPRYLLVKDWSCGFWADVDHVIGQLLLAEWTKRTPVIFWGASSLYHPGNVDNCFPLFFQPTSAIALSDLSTPGLTYFPPAFHAGNLGQPQGDQFSRSGSLDKGFSILDRQESVLVSDRHVGIDVLWGYWTSRAMGPVESLPAKVRRLFFQYLVPSDLVMRKVEAFWSSMPSDGPHWAAHVRGGDRTESFEKLDENNALYFERLDVLMETNPRSTLLLLTDSTYIVEKFSARYGPRLYFTDAQRSSNKIGVHYDPAASKADLGFETLVDVLLALKCDRFLGCMSNVSRYVDLLKDWGDASHLFRNVPSNIL